MDTLPIDDMDDCWINYLNTINVEGFDATNTLDVDALHVNGYYFNNVGISDATNVDIVDAHHVGFVDDYLVNG